MQQEHWRAVGATLGTQAHSNAPHLGLAEQNTGYRGSRAKTQEDSPAIAAVLAAVFALRPDPNQPPSDTSPSKIPLAFASFDLSIYLHENQLFTHQEKE